SISDISAVQSAEMILLNGAGFASWIDRVSLPRARVVNTSRAIEDQFIVTESITHSHGDGGEHSHEGVASYTWLDPMLASAQAEAVAAAIARKGLAPPDDVYSKLGALIGELETLDADAKLALSGARDIPMIATHPRYQYLAQRYDLSIASLEWEAGEAPSAEGLAELEALVSETGARILIWEAEPPAAAIEATDALGIQSVVFDPMAHAPSDGTYLGSFATAVTSLADAAGLRPAN
ncbi:MAG: metal ABC transporter substrate-binding protein, partial [Pseudomonadota bacterium]